MRSGTWHVVVPNGVDVAIDQFVYFSLWSDTDVILDGLVGPICCERNCAAIVRVTCCASNFDITAAIPAPAQAEIRADPSRKEALRKRYQPQAEQERRQWLGQVRIATGAGGPARARSEAEI